MFEIQLQVGSTTDGKTANWFAIAKWRTALNSYRQLISMIERYVRIMRRLRKTGPQWNYTAGQNRSHYNGIVGVRVTIGLAKTPQTDSPAILAALFPASPGADTFLELGGQRMAPPVTCASLGALFEESTSPNERAPDTLRRGVIDAEFADSDDPPAVAPDTSALQASDNQASVEPESTLDKPKRKGRIIRNAKGRFERIE